MLAPGPSEDLARRARGRRRHQRFRNLRAAVIGWANIVTERVFRMIVVVAAVALIVVVARVRFSEVPPLPPRPPMPATKEGTAGQLLHTTLTSPAVWQNFLRTDARAAGLSAPTPEMMGEVFPYKVEAKATVLTFDASAVIMAGLELRLERGERDATVLVMRNAGKGPVAYRVLTRTGLPASACSVAAPLGINALVLAPGQTIRRSECSSRTNNELTVLSAETIELPPLAAWYIQRVSPLAVGLEPRWARAHRPEVESSCSAIVPHAQRQALQKGDLTWRDLVDFYARHRCDTYQFPLSYRAFTESGQRPLPALPEDSSTSRN